MYLPVSAMDLFIPIRIKALVLPELVRRDQVGFRVMCFHLNAITEVCLKLKGLIPYCLCWSALG